MIYSEEQEKQWWEQKRIEEATDDKPHTCAYCKWRVIDTESINGTRDYKYLCEYSFRNNPRGRTRKIPKQYSCENYKKYVSYMRGA
ncbi:hypothetical protein FACS189499_03700 [Clostridia bacterium]|nr:hypothetical protein FACS189499_03700 [Clostridia bacterium]